MSLLPVGSGSSGGGVGRSVAWETVRESGFRTRFEMRLNGFSSTLRRRDLWRESGVGPDVSMSVQQGILDYGCVPSSG